MLKLLIQLMVVVEMISKIGFYTFSSYYIVWVILRTEIKILSKLNILPKGVIPNHYDISLDVDFDSFQFEGSEDIQIEILEPVSEIVLNSGDLEIISASFFSEGVLDSSNPKITIKI